ncbi:MAG: hypothetical protein LBH18_05940 [Spirochaetaceae bacterium]|jgi:hypothetical protein|nr:hypothetical protein [Spirochaetaceae bacterium]
MKKFFVILIILIALGSLCFFAGWAQLSVPHNSYGVLRSKTHGLYEHVIKDGNFTWLWYKLIPANTNIAVFDIKNQTVQVEASGGLPQAETYTAFVGLKSDFSWQVSGRVSFSINPDSLPRLVDQFSISNQSEFDAYITQLRLQLTPFIEQRLAYYCGQPEALTQINAESSYEPLTQDIQDAFPYITGLSCSLSVKRFPDYNLYNSAKSMYDDYISHQREILNAQISDNAAGRIKSQFRLDELARYGELITKYPLLLDYLKLPDAAE